MAEYFFDANNVRYELSGGYQDSSYNWLFFPGGPGADSRYFRPLLEPMKLPGNVWLVDLPGNGDNTDIVPQNYHYDAWFDLFLDTVKQFENPILVGHSFGGMLPLLFPELEKILRGLVVLNSAPSLWLDEAVKHAKERKLPDLSAEMKEFTRKPGRKTFLKALEACAPYYFPEHTLEKGRQLLSELPFNHSPAVWWQRKSVEIDYSAKWVPEHVPMLVVGSEFDAICPFSIFERDERFQGRNVEAVFIKGAGHLGWFEAPESYREAFYKFCGRLGLPLPNLEPEVCHSN